MSSFRLCDDGWRSRYRLLRIILILRLVMAGVRVRFGNANLDGQTRWGCMPMGVIFKRYVCIRYRRSKFDIKRSIIPPY